MTRHTTQGVGHLLGWDAAAARTPVCWRCATPSEQTRDGHPWCGRCGHYLVHDPEHGDWVTFADREYRHRTAVNQRRVADTAELAHRAVAELKDQMPDGWRISIPKHGDAGIHSVAVTPPAGPVDAAAHLLPSDGERGWAVRIHDRTRRVTFPLYEAGGAEAASFDTAADAAEAAIQALRIEIAVTRRH